MLTIGEILKLVIVERLFKLCRRKLLKIPLFAWGYGHWRQGVDWIVAMRGWQAARRWISLLKLRLHNLRRELKRASNYHRGANPLLLLDHEGDSDRWRRSFLSDTSAGDVLGSKIEPIGTAWISPSSNDVKI